MPVVTEMTLERMKEYSEKSYTNSHMLFEKIHSRHPEDALKYKTVPFIELGKMYHFEEDWYEMGVWIKLVWIGIVITLEPSRIIFKVLATNRDIFYTTGTGCADINCTTFYCLSRAENLHEVQPKDLPMYIGLGYVSPWVSTIIKEGAFQL